MRVGLAGLRSAPYIYYSQCVFSHTSGEHTATLKDLYLASSPSHKDWRAGISTTARLARAVPIQPAILDGNKGSARVHLVQALV